MSDLQTVLWTLPRIHAACRSRLSRGAARQAGASDHQARILSLLDHEDPTMVGELAEHMGVTPSTMSLNLKRLREAGLVTQERDPSDRRVMNVRLTAAGAEVRAVLGSLDPERVDGMLRRLGPEGRRTAVLGLKLLAAAAADLVSDA